ncbi:protein LEAD-SENSITIVE 1-like [Rhododendron vialii]|uniref:protein LEAD-SENSITIVE 1-like n=1 Tax=Rhododendron vialii TaxID=182163 RepID=UPI00265E8ED8|nr:protein LEAD-SENSITIVE 1-like [Rhododendron vialii]
MLGDFFFLDHIYAWRFLFSYAHHGIYIGDGLVIHFTAPPGKLTGSSPSSSRSAPEGPQKTCPNHPHCGSRKHGSGVSITCLDCFIGNGSLYRYEYGVTQLHFRFQLRGGACTAAQSDPASTVVQRAKYLFENGFGNYHLVKNNCEGAGRSGQIATHLSLFPKLSATLYPSSKGTFVDRVHKFSKGSYANDIGVRDDVIKAPGEDMDKFHRHFGGSLILATLR